MGMSRNASYNRFCFFCQEEYFSFLRLRSEKTNRNDIIIKNRKFAMGFTRGLRPFLPVPFLTGTMAIQPIAFNCVMSPLRRRRRGSGLAGIFDRRASTNLVDWGFAPGSDLGVGHRALSPDGTPHITLRVVLLCQVTVVRNEIT
jgi:hypothetical protein